MGEGEGTVFIGSSSAQRESPRAKLIKRSGCSDIQDAIKDMEKHGFSVDDLSPETQETVVGVMASAKEVGGEAAPRPLPREEK